MSLFLRQSLRSSLSSTLFVTRFSPHRRVNRVLLGGSSNRSRSVILHRAAIPDNELQDAVLKDIDSEGNYRGVISEQVELDTHWSTKWSDGTHSILKLVLVIILFFGSLFVIREFINRFYSQHRIRQAVLRDLPPLYYPHEGEEAIQKEEH